MPSFQHEVELGVSAPTMWNSLKDQNTLFPKLMPEAIASIEMIQGAGEPGTIRQINFTPMATANGGFAFVKEKLLSIDLEKFSAVSEEVEGGNKGAFGFTKWVHEIKIVPVDDKTSKLVFSAEYEGGSEDAASKAVARAKEYLTKAFKTFEEHIKSSA
ncbi:hypothetical protein MPTK1_8g08940 [Marchantia polymorpha subsp. ruderalis]|nr:hypothetical protein MARPO_0063s0025 [Marchantia polymorpha]BBN19235.1 hypothetical protein Mp_8g08940 [Marchantia polymorpha subsp. ruderalis]|eukprot:PTQ36477.1 hypothetical protein MARPO_0063s0025 [Marchantia polymorpha]